jgi:hypothetical protein
MLIPFLFGTWTSGTVIAPLDLRVLKYRIVVHRGGDGMVERGQSAACGLHDIRHYITGQV